MRPDMQAKPTMHKWILWFILSLPFLGWLSGSPDALAWMIIIAAIASLPYFALFAQAQADEQAQQQRNTRDAD